MSVLLLSSLGFPCSPQEHLEVAAVVVVRGAIAVGVQVDLDQLVNMNCCLPD